MRVYCVVRSATTCAWLPVSAYHVVGGTRIVHMTLGPLGACRVICVCANVCVRMHRRRGGAWHRARRRACGAEYRRKQMPWLLLRTVSPGTMQSLYRGRALALYYYGYLLWRCDSRFKFAAPRCV
jgi:hypothetical protein